MVTNDTIAAIATPPGCGGIGIIRISGVKAKERLRNLFHPVSSKFKDFIPWRLHRGHLLDNNRKILDDILAVFMPAPNTFTGEDIVELQCHGGYFLLTTILESVLDKDTRLAKPGEFSQRAFLNGRIDLTQAEAVAELIAASSHNEIILASNRLNGLLGKKILELREQIIQLRAWICLAVDFPEEESELFNVEKFLHGIEEIRSTVRQLIKDVERSRCWKEGIVVALAGAVNAGKSSLLNALIGSNRAIVTEFPGTTRDFLEEYIHIEGLPIRLIDTAGLRDTEDPIEAQGISIGREKIELADIVLLIVDGVIGITEEIQTLIKTLGARRIILVWNKIDLRVPPKQWPNVCTIMPARNVCVSAKNGSGIEELTKIIHEFGLSLHGAEEPSSDSIVPNIRQVETLSTALEELDALYDDIYYSIPYDLCAVRLEHVASVLASITGIDTSEDVLNRIFASFCIGK